MMSYELLKLPNVRVGKDAGAIDEVRMMSDAKRLAWEVATKNPLWTIEVMSPRTFLVLCDREQLGIIGSEWHGSSQKLFVRNDRIGMNSTRKSAYHTDKVDKALLKVKKNFGPMVLAERMGKAVQKAKECMNEQGYKKQLELRNHSGPINKSMVEYGRQHMLQYTQWLKNTHDAETLEHLTKLGEAQLDMRTIKEVTQCMDDEKFALVVLESGKYIVKIRDNVQLYGDTDLPYALRAKVGMLKLVEDEAMVTGIGCRVSSEIFVVMLNEEKGNALP
jgi:hypothetical protein